MGRHRKQQDSQQVVRYPLALIPKDGVPVMNPEDALAAAEAEATRLAIMKTSEKDICRITGLSVYMVQLLKKEVEKARSKRLKELETRGAEAPMEDVYDEILASEARSREWSAHQRYDLPTALKGQFLEAQFRMNALEKVILPRAPVKDADDEDDVESLLDDVSG